MGNLLLTVSRASVITDLRRHFAALSLMDMNILAYDGVAKGREGSVPCQEVATTHGDCEFLTLCFCEVGRENAKKGIVGILNVATSKTAFDDLKIVLRVLHRPNVFNSWLV